MASFHLLPFFSITSSPVDDQPQRRAARFIIITFLLVLCYVIYNYYYNVHVDNVSYMSQNEDHRDRATTGLFINEE
ncbi:hypothetical protein N7513_003925 [Penicillium frequentans]|nr:hypothetical protein N7513_003925 [Penicillium glabrum]